MKTKRFWKIFSVCLSVLILAIGITLSCVDFSPKQTQEENPNSATGPTNSGYWTDSGHYGTTAWSGSGTESDPYLIQSAQDLARLSYMVYSGSGPVTSSYCYYSGKYFKQTADIDLSAYYWQPIGTAYYRNGSSNLRWFSGNYDGGGHKVSGVFTQSGSTNAYSFQGLFGYVEGVSTSQKANLSNIGIINSFIQGYDNVGGLAGYSQSALITNCYNMGSVSGNEFIGGVTGYNRNYSLITSCYNMGSVTGASYVGGIAGHHTFSDFQSIKNCYNTGSVSGSHDIGGVCGYALSTISNCYNTGSVTGASDVGGIIGSSNSSEVINCYNTGLVRSNPKTVTLNANSLICSIGGRNYYLVNGGEVCLGIIGGQGVYGPIIVSESASAVTYKTSYDSSVFTYLGSLTYNGKTYYYNAHAYFMVGDSFTITNNRNLKQYNYHTTDWTTAVQNLLSDCIAKRGGGVLGHKSKGSISNCYYGGNCSSSLLGVGSDSSSGTATYVSNLASTSCAKSVTWHTNTSNWNSSYPWDFNSVWQIVSTKNSGYPILRNHYIISLDNAGGTGGQSSVEVIEGQAMPTITSLPTRTNYTFQGYYSGQNGSGTKYYNANGISAKTNNLTSDITLYAYWTLNQVDVILDQAGGSGGTTSVKATNDAAMPTITPPTREGYNFQGYYSGQNGSGTKYYNADGTSATTYNLTIGTTLYAYWVQKTWVDYASTTFGGGSGENVNDPYLISIPQHLALLAKNVNNGTTYAGKYFLQTADLNMGAYPWMPIANSTSKNFYGDYNGNNYKISGLQVNDSALPYVGLFGYLSDLKDSSGSFGAEVSNVEIKDSIFISTNSSAKVGSIAGCLTGNWGIVTVKNCKSNASVQGNNLVGGMIGSIELYGAVVSDLVFKGHVKGAGGFVGGILGKTDTRLSISDCYNFGDVESTNTSAYVGGIAGQAQIISRCISSGTITSAGYAGSIVGILVENSATINVTNCAGFGFIYGADATKCGGLVGTNSGTGNVTNSSFVGSSNLNIGAFYGSASSTALTLNSCYSYINNKGYYTAGDFNDWTIAGDFNDGLPIQNALYAIGIWENRGSDVIKFFTDNNFEPVS